MQEIETNKNKHKVYWANINKLLNPKACDPHFSLIDQNTQEAIPSDKTADYINTYFATIGGKLASGMTDPWTPQANIADSLHTFILATLEELIPLLKKINVNKSSGIEHVSTKVLKDSLLAIPRHFLFIINRILSTSTFHDNWKMALVSPLPKGGGGTLVM